MANENLMRKIPKVDILLSMPSLAGIPGATEAARAELDELRESIRAGEVTELPPQDALAEAILRRVKQNARPSLRPVVNGTGVILHTNLGRACLAKAAAEAVTRVAGGYSTLEYHVASGKRGSRHDHVAQLLCKLTGAEAAIAVNNNAAAVLLVLSALTKGREVPISRGELVEIGGSFRVPEVMEQGGAILREVGTTNKTHLSDYAAAINQETGALLKVHTSNYRIMGFTESVPLAELAGLAHANDLPLIEDLGSGALVPLEPYGILDEPFVQASMEAGADVITFSGDKLLGGPQAGIIIGKKRYIDVIKKHPLARALRIDKLTLAALEATLRLYLEARTDEIPVVAMLSAEPESLRVKADKLLAAAGEVPGARLEVVPTQGQVGGGSVPTHLLPSWALAVEADMGADLFEERLRALEPPIVGRIYKGRVLLDVRTLFEEEFAYIAASLREAAQKN